MKYLFIAFLFISSFISGQGIEPTSFQPTQYQGGILRGVIPYVDEFTGETLYIYQHVDSLVFIKDSIYVRNDSIFLRDGTGFAIVTDSIYNVSGSTKDTIKLRDGEGYALVDKALSNGVKGIGVATRVAWWLKSDSLSSTSRLNWDTLNNELEINSIPFGSNASEQLYVGLSAGYGATGATRSNFVGSNAGYNAVSANNSNFYGFNAGYNATYADQSNFFGSHAGYGATNSYLANFFGTFSGYNAVNAYYSNFFGVWSGYGATNARYANFYGVNAGYNATGAYLSNFFGENAGYGATGAFASNFFGSAAGFNSSSASYSNFFGYGTGGSGIGTNNIIIGKNITLPNGYASSMNIGSVLFGTGFWNSDNKTSGASTGGKIGILTNAPVKELHVVGEVRITDLTTDAPTRIVGADADGDLGAVTVGNGLNLDGGSLTVTANINGTQNRVAKFTSQYAVGNSEIYTVGDTLVGINQSNPQYHLDVNGKFRVSQRTGTAATGAGFTSDGQLISYSLDTASATPNTYVQSGTSINITGSGTMADPYTINNTAPENTTVKDSDQLDFSELSNDTITATIKTGAIGSTELASTSVTAGTYNYATVVVDADGRITSASTGTDKEGVTTVTATSPLTSSGGATPNITIQNASSSNTGALTSSDWTIFNNKIGGSGTVNYIPKFTSASSIGNSQMYDDGTNVGILRNVLINKANPVLTFQNSGSSIFKIGDEFGITGANPNNISAFVYDNYSFNIWTNYIKRFDINGSGTINISSLSGSGNRMVIANSSGNLSTQAIPTGTVTSVGVTAGTGISVSGSPITSSGNITVTNTGVTSLNGLAGSISLSTTNSGTYPNWFNSGNTLFYALPSGSSGQVLKHNGTGWTAGTDNDTDNQTLSFSSPNLSISGGNSVALPVLPSGTATSNTLRWGGSAWAETSMLKTTTARVDINSWPGTVNLGSKLLVNGHIQYTNTGFQASTITGRDTDGGLTGVTVGSGLSLSGGTLTATDASTSNEIQTLSHSAPTLSISSGNSITLTQQYGQMSSNGGCATVSTSYGTTVSGTAIGNNVTVSSTTITVPATGTYELNYSGYFILDPTASNVGVGMRVRKNGSSTVSVTIENIQGTASTEYRAMSKNVIVSLNSGDTLVLQPTKDAGTVNLCDYVMNIIRLN